MWAYEPVWGVIHHDFMPVWETDVKTNISNEKKTAHILTEESNVSYVLISHLGNLWKLNRNEMFTGEDDTSTKTSLMKSPSIYHVSSVDPAAAET